ncbi:MAG: hypothetical protein RRY35_05320, partial [Clostridiales bacterium]
MLDYLLINGFVVDGSGKPGQYRNIAIQNEKIVFVDHDCGEARRIIDVQGKCIFPGFIDMHTHSDYPLFIDGRAESFLHQGVAIDNFGNCGLSAAPLYGDAKLSKNVFCYTHSQKQITWGGLCDYFDALTSEHNLHLNVSTLIGHTAIRSCVMGYDNRPADAKEISAMCQLLQQC